MVKKDNSIQLFQCHTSGLLSRILGDKYVCAGEAKGIAGSKLIIVCPGAT